eukprot:scaffold91683_cov40-Prasinocladus_malaysianus.AAC.3
MGFDETGTGTRTRTSPEVTSADSRSRESRSRRARSRQASAWLSFRGVVLSFGPKPVSCYLSGGR